MWSWRMRAEYETPTVSSPEPITTICASAANRSRLAASETIKCACGLFQ